ncbi:HdeD family acid-resistance protein [Thiocystis violacea]|uniref:HdeD family acid-resistance protein n=1 Tax=Thiocystis violacea TaxID=13725 RepID=UPI0019057962|nr:DUF308 domain-containing protein [Thiocystis violacea]MBK1724021.1 hypothetical protein [Thiocystis violacea]
MQPIDTPVASDSATILERQIKGFGRHTFWIGILLTVLGAIGIALPPAMAITTVDLVSLVLFLGGGFWLWHTWQHGGGFTRWLKPLLLSVAGILMISSPLAGAAALALLLSFYLLLDAFGSFALAHELRPDPGWGWMVVNGVVDLALVAFFTFTWPASSVLLVGIFVGISLLFDGLALTMIGWSLRKG